MVKNLSASLPWLQGPDPNSSAPGPRWSSAPEPRLELAMVRPPPHPPWQILDPPLLTKQGLQSVDTFADVNNVSQRLYTALYTSILGLMHAQMFAFLVFQ